VKEAEKAAAIEQALRAQEVDITRAIEEALLAQNELPPQDPSTAAGGSSWQFSLGN
jgi:hypothetical protein